MRRLWLAVLAFLALSGPAFAEARIALVIGNSEYVGDMPKLTNPANDADLMGDTLRKLGFQVILVKDADLALMKRQISAFGDALIAGGKDAVGLFYYAGHGIQLQGENFLIPVNAHIEKSADADLEAVNANLILKQMEFAENALNIIILDACRNNPLSRGMRGGDLGLARMDAPMGSFIAYSTAPGATAADGTGRNSPYTTALARAITKKGIPIEEAFRDARVDVLTATNKKQIPWESSSLTGAFSFNPGDRGADMQITASIAPPAPAPAAATDAPAARSPSPAAPPAKPLCKNCPEMVKLEGGTFLMGAAPDEPDHTEVEVPQKEITLKPFSIGKYHVTVGQFAEFIAATGYSPSDRCDTQRRLEMKSADWRNPDIFEQGDNEPVICVSWKDATAYAKWLADTSGLPYRLPSEAEWEYAARAGVTGANYWSSPEGACAYANIADQTAKRRHSGWSITECNDGFYGLAPVGSLKPNDFGLYDMLGNAKQWVAGCATESIDAIPADGSPPEGGGSCSRALRGTAWDSLPQMVRFAYREGAPKSGYAATNIGFRVALGQ